MDAELLLDARNLQGASPVWHPYEDALYWLDNQARQLHRLGLRDHRWLHWAHPQRPGGIVLQDDGAWLCAQEDGLSLLHPRAGGLLHIEPQASIRHPLQRMRLAGGTCDRQGRFWTTSLLDDERAERPTGGLYRYAAGRLTQHLSQLLRPNGLAFSPDGATLYLADSHPAVQRIWAFEYDQDEGLPRQRRLFVDMTTLPGRPEGAAVDSDGCYWVCAADAGMLHRFTPQGRLDNSLTLPVAHPSGCTFAGSRQDCLMITSHRCASPDEQSMEGAVFALRCGATGIPATPFAVSD